MLETIIESKESLSNFVKAFRGVFKNKGQHGHFMAYILGLLIYTCSKNLTEISQAVPGRRDESSVYRFMPVQERDGLFIASHFGALMISPWLVLASTLSFKGLLPKNA